jgi:hypothetical protein
MKEIQNEYLGQKIYLLQESGKFEKKENLMEFVRKNRNKVEKGKGFTRYLIVADANGKKEKGTSSKSQNPSVSLDPIEYFYLETPNIPAEYFPIQTYGIYDRVTVEGEKIARLQEDIIKILGEFKKFGIFITDK